ncbi:uncharacterized protein [Palaemon carinicauda]|uniref:uncharacterized protein n=1 Tax=Palaemon carinicauda TaxID=392227 RepID=UPI0035B6AABD
MTSVLSHVIPSEALLKFRYYYFVRRFGKDVVYRVYKYCFLHGNPKTIRQILEDNGVNLGKKGPFNGQEITNLTTEPPENLDITVLNKICQTLWLKMVNYPGDKLRDLIRKIKDERNAVSHEEGNITENELEIKLLAFESTLKEALDEASIIYPSQRTEFDQLKLEVTDIVPKIQEKIREKYDPSNPDHVQRLKKEMEEFADQLQDYIQEKCKEELASHYSVSCRILPFDWLTQYGVTDPGEIMVSLRMDADEEFHAGLSKRESLIINQNEVLDKKNPSGQDPKVVILSGGAGSGKTTMLCSIVEKWYKQSNDVINLDSFQMLLYMEFRKDDYDNFETYIKDLLHCTMQDFSFDLVKSSILRSKCLILCDGFDEANKRSKKLFEEILRLNCKDMKILVTTRPINTLELTNMVNKSKHHRINLSMLGIPKDVLDSHMKTLVSHLLKTDPIRRDEIIKDITKILKTMNNEMGRILRNPLWFNLFVLLYIECPAIRGNLNTVSSLYTQLKKHNKKRLTEKYGIEEDNVDKFESLYKKRSLLYYIQQKYELSQDDTKIFKTKLEELDLVFNTVMSSYFNIKHTTKDLEVVKIFSYRHRSEQEFIAASVICDEMIRLYEDERDKFEELKEKGENIINYVVSSLPYLNEGKKQLTEDLNLDGLMPFITGILYNTAIDILYLIVEDILNLHLEIRGKWKIREEQYLSEVIDTDSFLKYITETRNDDKFIKCVIKILKDLCGGNIGILHMTEDEFLACIPLLVPEITVKTLECSFHSNPDDLPNLIPTLSTASQCNIEVTLRFPNQWPDGSDGNADSCLEKAVTCVKFEGKLTQYGIRCIPKCMRILGLRVDLNALGAMSAHIQVLSCLRSLGKRSFFVLIRMLYVFMMTDIQPKIWLGNLSPIDFRGEKFYVNFLTDQDVTVDSNLERMATVLNGFWPPKRRQSEDEITALNISSLLSSKFTGNGIKLLVTKLKVEPLSRLDIYGGSDEALEKENEIYEHFKDRKFGSFQLSKIVLQVFH